MASVERPDEIAGISEEIAVPNYAVDCDTGSIEPIEPVSWRWEVGTRRIERIGDRTFTHNYDAEGNGDVTNEAGISINGDDYAGYHEFSADGSRVVYGDMTDRIHVTTILRSRDTTTGELLWSAELDQPVGLTYWYGDRVVALAPADGVPGLAYEAVIVLDAATGEVIETVPTTRRPRLRRVITGHRAMLRSRHCRTSGRSRNNRSTPLMIAPNSWCPGSR